MTCDFELDIAPAAVPGTYTVTVESPAGTANGRARLDANGLMSRRHELEVNVLASAATTRARLSALERPVREVGQALFETADREMLAAQRAGDAVEALANLAERGRFHVAATPEQADGEVLAAYRRFRDQGRSMTDLFVNTDTSNARVDTYNRLIQNDRLARGEVGRRHLDYRSPTPGGTRRSMRVTGSRWCEASRTGAPASPTAQGHDPAHRHRAPPGIVRLDDGEAVRVDIPLADPMVPLCLAYAGHATRTQGSEAPVVLVVPGNAHTTLESAYSSLSRGQEEIHVFADTTTHGPDPLSHLAKR